MHIIYSSEKESSSGQMCLLFQELKKKDKTKETRLEDTSRLYKDSAVLDEPVLSVNG